MKYQQLIYYVLFLSTTLNGQTDKISRIWTSPSVITNESELFSLRFEAEDADIDSIKIYSGSTDFIINGQQVPYVLLLDNGNDVDLVLNDGIFSSPFLEIWTSITLSKPTYITIRFEDIDFYYGDQIVSESNNSNIPLRVYDPEVLPEVYSLGDTAQYTNHVFNVVAPEYVPFLSLLNDMNLFYNNFEDNKNLVVRCLTYEKYGSEYSSSHFKVQENVMGVSTDDDLFDHSGTYGSEGELESIIKLYSGGESKILTFLHELNHKWSAYLPEEFGLNDNYGHWKNTFELVGNGFGGAGVQDIKDNNNGTYTMVKGMVPSASYSDMDMYLAGYIGIDDVSWPIKVMFPDSFVGYDNGNLVYASDSPIFELTKEIYLSKMTERLPLPQDARKEHGMVFVVRSTEKLSPEEMAYWHTIAVEHERTDGNSIYSPRTFHEITRGEGTLNTTLTPLNPASTNNPIVNDFEIHPNPTNDIIYISSQEEMVSIRIYDLSGKVLFQRNSSGLTDRISTKQLSYGAYMLVIGDKTGKVMTTKFVKN